MQRPVPGGVGSDLAPIFVREEISLQQAWVHLCHEFGAQALAAHLPSLQLPETSANKGPANLRCLRVLLASPVS